MLGEGLAVGLGLDVGFLDDGLGVGVAVVDGLDVGLGLVLALALLLGLVVALALLLGLVLALLLGLELALEELLGLAFALADLLSLADADEVLPGLPPADILTGVDLSPVSVTEATRTESFGIDEHATFTMGWLGNSVARAWPNMPQLM